MTRNCHHRPWPCRSALNRVRVMVRLIGSGSVLLVWAGLLASSPALADSGSEWFDALTTELRRALRVEAAQPTAGRARFMACGYVAPGLATWEAPRSGDDRAVAEMLEHLRSQLGGFGSGP